MRRPKDIINTHKKKQELWIKQTKQNSFVFLKIQKTSIESLYNNVIIMSVINEQWYIYLYFLCCFDRFKSQENNVIYNTIFFFLQL